MGHLGPRLEINWKIIRSHIRKKTIYTYLPRYLPTFPFNKEADTTINQRGMSEQRLPDGGKGEAESPISAEGSPVQGRKGLPSPKPLPSLSPEALDSLATR